MSKITRIVSFLVLSAALLACSGGTSPSQPTEAPVSSDAEKLTVVVLVLDSLMPDEIGLSTPNLFSLKDQGTFYTESRAMFSAETIPNHVAMMTGVNPNRNGIPTNNFWDREARPDNPDGEDLDNPNELTAKTLFTWVDERCRSEAALRNPRIRTAAVMSKAYLYEIFRGDEADPQDNDAGINNVAPDSNWDPRSSSLYIGPQAEYTPDEGTIGEALSRLEDSDFVFINLGSIDRAAHAFGPIVRNGQILLTDQHVGSIVQTLQDAGKWDNTVMIIVSDHGMDFDGGTGGLATSPLTHDIVVQGMLDELPGCGLEPMMAVQNGGTDSLYITNLQASAPARNETLRTVRNCLVDPDGDICQAACDGAGLGSATNGGGVDAAWYVQNNPLDPAGNMPSSVQSSHENLGDLVVLAADGYNFAEPDLSGNPIPGNHGHAVTFRNTMLVTGGASWINQGVEVVPSVETVAPLDRLPEQSENIDVAATVAWLLGLSIPNSAFPDGRGFDGRVLSEAFSQFAGNTSPVSPSSCGLISAE